MHEHEPSAQAREQIARHLAEEHGRADLDLRRDVAFPGNDAGAEALIAYLAQSARASARFTCSACPGLIFVAGEPAYGAPERHVWLLLAHPELRTTLLAGVNDPAEQALLLEEWDRGNLGAAQVRAVRQRHSLRTKKADRPTVEARRARCQAFLLERVERGQSVEAAVGALVALRSVEPAAYERIMGCATAYAPETLRRHWRDIDRALRDAARATGAARAR